MAEAEPFGHQREAAAEVAHMARHPACAAPIAMLITPISSSTWLIVNGVHVFAWLPDFQTRSEACREEGTLRNHIKVKGIVS